MTLLQRAIRRTLKLLEREPQAEPWLVDLRLPITGTLASMHPQIVALGASAADWHPPASGPEIQVTLEIWATTGEIAERQARRRADGQGLQVLASRTWQWPAGDTSEWTTPRHDHRDPDLERRQRAAAIEESRYGRRH